MSTITFSIDFHVIVKRVLFSYPNRRDFLRNNQILVTGENCFPSYSFSSPQCMITAYFQSPELLDSKTFDKPEPVAICVQ